MSLINEALRKAQARQRAALSQEATLEGEGAGVATVRMSAPATSTSVTLKIFLGMTVVALLLSASMAYVVFQMSRGEESGLAVGDTSGSPTTSPSPVDSNMTRSGTTPTAEEHSPEPAPARETTSTTGSLLEQTRELDTSSHERAAALDRMVEREPMPEPRLPAEDRPETTAAGSAEPTVSRSPAVPTEPRDRASVDSNWVRDYLDRLEIRGIFTGSNRVLIHDRETRRTQSYQNGSLVHREPSVLIHEIREDSVVFEDQTGTHYVKYF